METQIAKLQARHSCSEVKKQYSQESNELHSYLYLAKEAGVMLPSNLWRKIGLHNSAREKVIDFVCMNSDGTLSKTFTEAVVVQFSHLDLDMPAFLEDYPGSVAIPTINTE